MNILRRPGFWIAAVLCMVVAAVVLARARGPLLRTVAVTRADLEQHIVASGRVRAEARVQVSAQVPGLVIAVGAVEGQHVKAGDLLVQLDDAEARAVVTHAKAVVEQARARVEQLQRVGAIVTGEGLKQAETNLQRAQIDEQRTAKLLASGAVAPIELDNARRAVELAQAQRNAAQAQQLAAAPTGADSRVALTQLLQAQAQLTSAGLRASQTRLSASQDGVVLTRSVEPGDVVQPGRLLMVMASDGDVQVVIQPDERNLANLKLGQRARASADAFPQQVFDAEVAYIAPSVDPQRGSVEVRLRVANPPQILKPDMTISVDLTVATKSAALTLPAEAVRAASSGAPWVFVIDDGRLARRPVKLGIRGDDSVEIASGLAASTEVVVPDTRLLQPGQRVRSQREGQ